MKIICSKTGLKFEGTSRQKNHPEVSKILTEAHRLGTYSDVLSACNSIKSTEISVNDAISFLNKVMNEASQEKRLASIEKSRSIKEYWKEMSKSSKNNFTDEEDLDNAHYRRVKSGIVHESPRDFVEL